MSLGQYLELPYTLILKKDEDGDYVASIKELRGCVAHGSTSVDALQAIESMKALWIESCIADGKPVPLPEEDSDLPSGKWLQRTPRSLHAALVRLAENDGVSLNQFVVAVLSKEVGAREKHHTAVVTIQAAQAAARAFADLWAIHADAGKSWQVPASRARNSQAHSTDLTWLISQSREEKGVFHGKSQEDAHQYCH